MCLYNYILVLTLNFLRILKCNSIKVKQHFWVSVLNCPMINLYKITTSWTPVLWKRWQRTTCNFVTLLFSLCLTMLTTDSPSEEIAEPLRADLIRCTGAGDRGIRDNSPAAAATGHYIRYAMCRPTWLNAWDMMRRLGDYNLSEP